MSTVYSKIRYYIELHYGHLVDVIANSSSKFIYEYLTDHSLKVLHIALKQLVGVSRLNKTATLLSNFVENSHHLDPWFASSMLARSMAWCKC